jgi:hypothetical protein
MTAVNHAERSCDHELCGLLRVRIPLAASFVLVVEELFPVPGYGSGWGHRGG